MIKKILRKIQKIGRSVAVYAIWTIAKVMLAPARLISCMRRRTALSSPSKVLITFFGRGLGDCIYFSGVLKPIREKYPKAKIQLAIFSQMENYFSGHPALDSIIPCPDYLGEGWRGFLSFISSAQKAGPVDLLIELLPSRLLGPAVWGLFIRKVTSTGIGDVPKNAFYDTAVPIPWKRPFFEAILDGLKPLGIAVHQPSFWMPEVSLSNLNIPPLDAKSAIVLAPGGKRNVEAPKDYCWTFEGFPHLVRRLLAQNRKIILTGAPYDRESCENLPSDPRVIDLVGKTSLQQLFTIVKKYALLVVCNNSGLLHVASVQNVPSVSYADPQENLLRWGPYPHPENHAVLQDKPGLPVTAQDLFDAVLQKLNGQHPSCDKE